MFYSLNLIIGSYIVFYQIYWSRGYQFCEEAIGATISRVKGAARGPDGGIWDSAMLSQPGHENAALFIATRSDEASTTENGEGGQAGASV